MLSSRCPAACNTWRSQQRARVVACARPTRSAASATTSPAMQGTRMQLMSSAAAAAVVLALLGGPSQAQAAELSTLADVMRPTFEFVDANKDGEVTLAELQQLSTQVSEEEGFAQPSTEQLSFTLRLFDLNQDGTLSTNEMLTSLALDAVVTDDAVDADAVKVFDRDGDGFVERKDWAKPFGDMGRQGEVTKEYVFDRVDHLYDGNGKLDARELVNALNLVRTVALGY